MTIFSAPFPPASVLRFAAGCFLAASTYAGLAHSADVRVLPLSSSGHDRFFGVAFDASGAYYAVGSYAAGPVGSDSQTLIAKFKSDGQLDASFGQQGYVLYNLRTAGEGESARSVAVDSRGRIVVGGSVEGGSDPRDRDLALLRLLPGGQLDPTFGSKGISLLNLSEGAADGAGFTGDTFGGFALDANARIYVHGSQKRSGGTDSDFVMLRLNADGQVDKTYGEQGRFTLDIAQASASPKTPVLTANGEVTGTGYMRRDGLVMPVIYRLDTQGKLDKSFAQQGIFNQAVLNDVSEVYGAVAQGDALVTVGYGKSKDQSSLDFLSIRLTANGQLDTSYGTGGGYTQVDVDGFNDNGRNLVGLPDGRILLIGGGRYSSGNVDGMSVVLSAKGIPDETFGENGSQLFEFGGLNDFLWGVAVAPSKDYAIAVGIKGNGDQGDDAALVRIPL